MVRFAASARQQEEVTHPLTPIQAGMLFHALRRDHGSAAGYDIEQIELELAVVLDPGLLRRAWARVATRHEALRSSFRWSGPHGPERVVHQEVPIEIDVHDLRRLSEERRAEYREGFLARDRERGFDLASAPLERVTLLRTGEATTTLVWTVHHAVIDGRSFAVVLGEVFAIYAALAQGAQLPAFAAPAARFSDYGEWLAANERGTALAHFRALLAGKVRPTRLPRTREHPLSVPESGRGVLSQSLPAELTEAVASLARRSGTTVLTVVRAAWALVLARATGDDDVVFGVSVSGRYALDGRVQDIVGAFTNTLPFRVRVSDSEGVHALLAAIRGQSLALRPFEHALLADVQRQSELPPGEALFETLLMFDNRDLAGELARIPELAPSLRSVVVHEQPTLPLVVTVHQGRELGIRFLFERAIVGEAAARRLLEAFTFVLSELTREECVRVGDVPTLPPRERERLLFDWNDTARPFPSEHLLHTAFEARAAQQPSAIALISEGRSVSYAELAQAAQQRAAALRSRGVGPGTYVGVCLPRSVDLVVSLLAVSMSGAAYVPLDPDYPLGRLQYMANDAELHSVLTDSRYEHYFPERAWVPGGSGHEETSPEAVEPAGATPRDPCYVIYTSGSTGQPKGAVLTHRAVVNTLDWVNRTFAVGPGDRLLFVTSPSFDLSVYDVFGVLGAGATLVISEPKAFERPEELAAMLVEERITIWNSAPPALGLLLPLIPGRTSLRLVLLSGDWIPVGMPTALMAGTPGVRVVSLGGATEAAIWSNWFPIESVPEHWRSVPYGRPIQNCRYHALDAQLRPVPVGATGELYIGGECVAQGYLGRPELTAQRFVPDPFATEPGARLYRTGDLVRYFGDGNLELIGRCDDQLKIRGYRVEPTEVEAALASLPGIRQALCSSRIDAAGQRVLVAHVVAEEPAATSEALLKSLLAKRVPAFMVPGEIIVLANMPLSPNGKIDRAALSRMTAPVVAAEARPLATPTERRIAEIWRRALGRESVSASDDFFALGGHSLLAIDVFNEIIRTYGVRLHLASLFEHRLLAELAAHVDRLTKSESESLPWTTIVPIQPQGSLPPLFCVAGSGGSPIAERYLAEALGPEQPLFGLQHRGADGQQQPHTSVSEMAAEFLADVRRLQPQGPYYFAGFSGGGVLAYEMARQVVQAGEQVALVVLLDAFNPSLGKWSAPERFANFWRLAAHHGSGYAWKRLKARIAVGMEEFRQRFSGPSFRADDLRRRNRALQIAFTEALDRHKPGPYAGNTLLIRTSGKPCPNVDYRLHESNGWGPLISGDFKIVSLDCRHDQLLADGIGITAEIVREALSAARQRASRVESGAPLAESPLTLSACGAFMDRAPLSERDISAGRAML